MNTRQFLIGHTKIAHHMENAHTEKYRHMSNCSYTETVLSNSRKANGSNWWYVNITYSFIYDYSRSASLFQFPISSSFMFSLAFPSLFPFPIPFPFRRFRSHSVPIPEMHTTLSTKKYEIKEIGTAVLEL